MRSGRGFLAAASALLIASGATLVVAQQSTPPAEEPGLLTWVLPDGEPTNPLPLALEVVPAPAEPPAYAALLVAIEGAASFSFSDPNDQTSPPIRAAAQKPARLAIVARSTSANAAIQPGRVLLEGEVTGSGPWRVTVWADETRGGLRAWDGSAQAVDFESPLAVTSQGDFAAPPKRPAQALPAPSPEAPAPEPATP